MSITCSQFNYLYSENGSFALWNTLSGQFVRLPQGVYHALKSGELSSLDGTEVVALKKVGALVDDSTNELALFESVTARQRNEVPWKYRILTTTACNARCSYCYEKGTALSTMDPDTAEKTAGLIIRNYQTQPTDIILEWFGGEPLLNAGPITSICGRLSEAGVPFASYITTNGLLLDECLLACCGDWHLRGLQITLDGLGEQYERIKAVPPGSFERLTDNIRSALEKGLRVKIRINESGDIEAEKLLIRRLKELFGRNPLLSVYGSPLYRTGKSVDRDRMERILTLEQELFRCGFAEEKDFYSFRPRFTRCFACSGKGFTVFPDGRLYNCSHCFEEDGCIGNVDTQERNEEKRKKYTEAGLSTECWKCVFLPLCAGGCRSAELGLAEMNQCFPYKSVMDKVASLRLKYADYLIKDNNLKTRLCSQCGESILDREKSKESLSHEEVCLEINKKPSNILLLLEGESVMQALSPNRNLTVEEQNVFGKVLFEDIFPLVNEHFATADRIDCNKAAFCASASGELSDHSASVSVRPSGFYTAVYESEQDTWGSLDTWSGEVSTTKKAAVYSLSDESARCDLDWVPGWDQYDGVFSDAVKTIGESAAEAKQALLENTFLIVFRAPLGLKGWFGISFEERDVEERDGDTIKDEYKKWVLKKPVEETPQGKFCPKCGAPLNPDMLFCYRCGAEVSGNTKVPQKAKKVNLYGWKASREFLVQVANRVFEPDEEPYMGEYSGEENRIAAVMEMLKALLGNRCTLVESKWGDYYNGLSAEKGEIEWRETVQGHSCDGCYDGGCGGPDFDIYKYRIVKISPEEYEKEKSSAVASGVAIESTGLGERFRINKGSSETVRRTTYMKNFQNLSGYYRYYTGD